MKVFKDYISKIKIGQVYVFYVLLVHSHSVNVVNIHLSGDFRGNGASVIRIVPYAALHFMTYDRYKCWILNNCPMLGSGPVVDLLAGSAAGGTSVICTYPLDLARTRLAYQVDATILESLHAIWCCEPLIAICFFAFFLR